MRFIFLFFYYLIIRHLPSSYFPLGALFNCIRVFFLRRLIKVGDRTLIQSGFRFGNKEVIKIGNNCRINENVYIQSCSIGNYVMIAPNVTILGSSHKFDSINIPMILQGEHENKSPVIEDDVWIGRNVIIMPGVKIGYGSIIGAGAVLTKDVAPYSIMGGVPAKLIRYRVQQNQKAKL